MAGFAGLAHPAPMSNVRALPAPKPRISAKVRAAVDARVRQGLSIAEAAKAASLSKNGFAKALKRPAVQDHLQEVQRAFVAEAEASRALLKVRALEVAADLMMNAKSEAVRARMVEFLAGDGKAPQVAVHVDARQTSPGYEYLPRGSRIVEIEPGQGTQDEIS
jgi:hypothetical protein